LLLTESFHTEKRPLGDPKGVLPIVFLLNNRATKNFKGFTLQQLTGVQNGKGLTLIFMGVAFLSNGENPNKIHRKPKLTIFS